ncbi:RagB/SusD family nutrient uptake outer membrane protein [Sphingobacterium alkalisoli]|uniref:RagB/SusD family nutrient uptake outer membrane protein n=1 Tax=Sphingobacterium alkalisoli TaxID=1874115 RepID=A0A4U0H9H0_9SPHI|nr:RagB/SusD family nutrient uptake outer membrane protein [Sphingobacterium alkalisoli]TJY68500.1 RagB/SusD family nutrient uptake outer membrane protein [Sphingobacterium alkalisoli]GGH06060.1 starch-binding protein [Sphingobacterium alkalisoli]
MRKKLVLYIITIGATLLASSCQKWLDLPSQSDFDSSTIFENPSRVEMALLGAYTSTSNQELYYQFGMGTDEAFSTEGETNSKNMVSNYVYNPSTTPTSTYTSMYSGVEQVNVLIKGITAMDATDAERSQLNMLLGEAYAIRAKNMLNVVRFFGDVPYPLVPVVDAESFSSSRVNRDIILDGCISDLQQAIELLPWKSASGLSSERISKNAAYGLLARVALYAAGYSLRWDLDSYLPGTVKLGKRSDPVRVQELYQIAADACEQVITQGGHSLSPTFESVFRDVTNKRYNNENILEYGQEGPDRNELRNGYTNGIFMHTLSVVKKSQPAMAVIPTLYFEFDNGDTRRDVTISNYSITAENGYQMNTYANHTIGKYRANWGAELGPREHQRNFNWIDLRYSDILLMYAEAANEVNNGPTALAKERYEEVRLRAFNNNPDLIGETPSDYEGFRNAIIQERKLELAFEGWRRTDLIRWGILFEKLTATKSDILDLARHQGKYVNVPRFRAYKIDAVAKLSDPTVAIPYQGFVSAPTTQERATLEGDGYTILDMYGRNAAFFANSFTPTEVWVTNIYRGLEKNKVELFPLNTQTIDANPGLRGQQHPLY